MSSDVAWNASSPATCVLRRASDIFQKDASIAVEKYDISTNANSVGRAGFITARIGGESLLCAPERRRLNSSFGEVPASRAFAILIRSVSCNRRYKSVAREKKRSLEQGVVLSAQLASQFNDSRKIAPSCSFLKIIRQGS